MFERRYIFLCRCDDVNIKITTGVSVGAGLSLHRHQANFSRVFDIYFGRYYWNIFTLFPQKFFFSLIFHLVFCPLETRKQCNVLKASMLPWTLKHDEKYNLPTLEIFRVETENHPEQQISLGLLSGNLDNTTLLSMSSLIVVSDSRIGWGHHMSHHLILIDKNISCLSGCSY